MQELSMFLINTRWCLDRVYYHNEFPAKEFGLLSLFFFFFQTSGSAKKISSSKRKTPASQKKSRRGGRLRGKFCPLSFDFRVKLSCTFGQKRFYMVHIVTIGPDSGFVFSSKY